MILNIKMKKKIIKNRNLKIKINQKVMPKKENTKRKEKD